MKIPCFILCRKNSKGLKNKNKLKIGNKTLFDITLDYVKKCKYVTNIVVNSDDSLILKKAKLKKCFVIKRPKNLSGDRVSSENVLKHSIQIFEKKFGKTKYSGYVQVTEPFRPKNILNNCFKKIINTKFDSCFAAYIHHKNFWLLKKKNRLVRLTKFNERKKPRQTKKPILREDTGIALATKSYYLRKGERIGKNVTCIFYDDPKYNIDINRLEDLKLARKIFSNKS